MPITDSRTPWAHLSALRGLLARHPIVAVSAPIFLGLAVQAWVHRSSEWVAVYVPAARALLAGRDFYSAAPMYVYPPFSTLLAVPFVDLPDAVIRLAWWLVNVPAIVWLVRSAWIMAGGSAFASREPADRREWLAFGLGLLCITPYVVNALGHQQTDLLIAALLTTGCYAALQGRRVTGGVLIGLAAAFKGPPLLFVGYLVFRKRWLTAALALAVAIGVNLAPDLIDHPQRGTWLGYWISRIVLPAESLRTELGTWTFHTFNVYNQSLAGTFQRLTHSALVFRSGRVDMIPKSSSVGVITMKVVAYSSMLLMVLISIGAAVVGQLRAKGAEPSAGLPSRTAIEIGMMMILVLLISPMSDLSHFPIIATLVFCLSRLALLAKSRVAFAAALIAVVAALLANKDLVGPAAYDVIRWFGAPTWSLVALWLGGVLILIDGGAGAAIAQFSTSPLDGLIHSPASGDSVAR